MTIVWLTDIFIGGKKAVTFDDIEKGITLHSKISEEGNIVNSKVLQDSKCKLRVRVLDED